MTETKKNFPPIWLLVLFGLALLGLLIDSTYLLLRHVDIEEGAVEIGTGVCGRFGGGCDEVLATSYATVLGISSGAWGVAYGVVVLLLLLGLIGGWGPRKSIGSCLVLFTGLGLAGSLAFLKILYFDIHGRCPLCLTYHFCNLVMSCSAWAITSTWVPFSSKPSSVPEPDDTSPWLLVPSLGLPVLAGLVLLLGYFAWHTHTKYTAFQDQMNELLPPAEQAQLLFEKSPQQFIPNDPAVPALGPLDAPHVLTVFSDFECPYCANASEFVHALHEEYPETLRIVYRHYPLGVDCNPSVAEGGVDLHPHSCVAAEATEAAQLQGKYWEFHNLVYERRKGLDSHPFKLWAEELGMDVEKFADDMARSAGRERIRKDVELGDRLHVDSTPTLFLDGRELNFWHKKDIWEKFAEKYLSK